MKTINAFCIALFLVFSIACSSDDEPISPVLNSVTVEFPEDLSVMEEAANHEIEINFSGPAPIDGLITIKLNSGEAVPFETVPAMVDGEIEIEVLKGDNSASFFLIPEENEILEDNKSLVFELLKTTKGFLLGNKKLLNITITEDEQAAKADFVSVYSVVMENYPGTIDLEVDILGEAPGEGSISIQIEGDPVGDLFITVPNLDASGKIIIPVPSGATKVGFQIEPIDDNILKAHHNFQFRIVEASGSVTIGDLPVMNFLLLDDELYGKPKSSETTNEEGVYTKTLEYDTQGKIKKVKTESTNPEYFGKTETYDYENGQLKTIILFPGDFDSFTYFDGKVVKIEQIRGFFRIGYSLYEYNAAGKLIKKTDFLVNANEQETITGVHQYSYYPDGNIKTQILTRPEENNSLQVVSSITYLSYSSVKHPFPLEVVPTQPLQQTLPGMIEVEENGVKNTSYFTLEYNVQGLISRQTSIEETIKYYYY